MENCLQSLFQKKISTMPCEVFTFENQKPQKPHRPLMVQVKINDHSRKAFVLAAGSFHSFNRCIRTLFHNFIRSPHQLQHPTRNAPVKSTVDNHYRFVQPLLTMLLWIFAKGQQSLV